MNTNEVMLACVERARKISYERLYREVAACNLFNGLTEFEAAIRTLVRAGKIAVIQENTEFYIITKDNHGRRTEEPLYY